MLFITAKAQGGDRIQGPMPANRMGQRLTREGANMTQGEFNRAFREESVARNTRNAALTDGRVNAIPANTRGGGQRPAVRPNARRTRG